MTGDPLQFQREYQQEKMPFQPGHVKSKLVMLGALFIFGVIGAWFFYPTSALANLPYCINVFSSSNSSASEVTLNGVFMAKHIGPHGKYYDILRFYEDGSAMYTLQFSNNIVFEWRKISFWFNKESDQAKNMQGSYEIHDNQIKIITFNYPYPGSEPNRIAWAGTFSETELDLIWARYFTGSDKFTRFEVEQCPFTK
jgi:hypothetical protein